MGLRRALRFAMLRFSTQLMPSPSKTSPFSIYGVGSARRVPGGNVMTTLCMGEELVQVSATPEMWATLAKRVTLEVENGIGRPPASDAEPR